LFFFSFLTAVVKIQSRFDSDSQDIWTMGTGWLIRKDLVVTAGHNVYSTSYGGKANQIKCWVGYYGRDSINEREVQHRKALNVVTTARWFQEGPGPDCRIRDVALIQVSVPFEGKLRLFPFISAPEKLTFHLRVVGYPGDLPKDTDKKEKGSSMYVGERKVNFDLNTTKNHMIEYSIDTFGGKISFLRNFKAAVRVWSLILFL
jgi:V8-like Glu-specific endopeptidase